MRVTLVTMDHLAVLVLLESRVTVVSPALLEALDLLVLLDPLDLLALLADPETVVRLDPLDRLDPPALLVPEVLLDLLESVVRRDLLETREREA